MKCMKVKIKKLSENAVIPQYQTEQAAGCDLHAILDESVTLRSLERKLIPTDLSIELPVGYEAQVRPRSGLTLKHGVTVLNTPGTVDADFRGNIGVILVNLSTEPYTVQPGERIAQLVIVKHEHVEFEEVQELSETERGDAGFGSSGK